MGKRHDRPSNQGSFSGGGENLSQKLKNVLEVTMLKKVRRMVSFSNPLAQSTSVCQARFPEFESISGSWPCP
jgi:hypothetical protein